MSAPATPEASLAAVLPDMAAWWHPTLNGNLTPRDVTAGSGKSVWWTCEHGHAVEQTVNQRRRKNLGCPYCSGQRVWAGFNDIATTHPRVAAQWHPTKNGDLTPTQVGRGSDRKAWWLPPCGHEFDQVVKSRVAQADRCPLCSGVRVIPGQNSLAVLDPTTAAQWHPTRNGVLTPDCIGIGHPEKVWWVDAAGHSFRARPFHVRHGGGCPRCARKGVSTVELAVADALNHAGLPQQEGTIPLPGWGRYGRARCDVVIPGLRVIVEYDGAYWHADKTAKDERKTRMLLDAGWAVIRVREAPLPPLGVTHPRYTEVTYALRGRGDVGDLSDRIVLALLDLMRG